MLFTSQGKRPAGTAENAPKKIFEKGLDKLGTPCYNPKRERGTPKNDNRTEVNTMKDNTVKKCYAFHVYKHSGRYYLDLYRTGKPIHSYETLQGVAETLYYGDIIPEKTVAAMMNF